ncbi:MAG: HNH endonuclease signature motif containing protein [Petrotogales bacterium]
MKCSTVGCEKEAKHRGYCVACYNRLLRSGELKKLHVKKYDKCAVEECNNLVGGDGGFGYCRIHYQRYKKNGDPNIVNWQPLKGNTLEEKLRFNFRINPISHCWEWQGSLNRQNYGGIAVGNGKTKLVHRLAYELWIGEIPEGLFVCHYCDNPRCINPAHLFLGTNNDNIKDKIVKGRAYTGNHKGEKNVQSKLKDWQVYEIKKLLTFSNMSLREIGKLFNVSYGIIWEIKRNNRWVHIPWPKLNRRKKHSPY